MPISSPVKDSIQFRNELQRLAAIRKNSKNRAPRINRLTKSQRLEIWAKTGGNCHICGIKFKLNAFEADHIKSHTAGGSSLIDNFLPACKTCNNYRWHYGPEELQWILKLGVWARTQIHNETKLGLDLAERFIAKEIVREGRKKKSGKI